MKAKDPTPLPFQLLKWFCPDHLYEEIEGDLIQKFNRDVERVGKKKAKRRLAWNAIRFFRPGIVLRNKFSFKNNRPTLYGNYLTTSLRYIKKNKVNFGFKLGGLSLAIFSFLSIAIYVNYQWSFDTYHSNYENIYRVNSQRKENGQIEKYAISPLAIGPMLKEYIPEIEAFVRVRFANITYLRHEDNVIGCEGLILTDSSLFDVLTYRFIAGTPDALKNPNGIVLTKAKAIDLFGTTDVLGKIVTINNDKHPFEVTAVIEYPSNTCFAFNAAIQNKEEFEFSLASINSPVEFMDHSSTLFVRSTQPLNGDITAKVEAVLNQFVKKTDRVETGFELTFQPLKDVYLGPKLKAEFAGKGNPVYVYAFSILGILLLIVAAINYINLSIADFSSRAKETGVRKVLGARKYQLLTQVVLETILFSVISLVLGLLLLYLMFPQIMQLLDSDLRMDMLLDKRLLVVLSLSLLVLVFLSSWFPARQFAYSGISKNLKLKISGYNSTPSQVLLFTQFAISTICIACTIVAGLQVDFIHNKELGFNKKNLLVFSLPEDFTVSKMKVLKQKLKEVTGVTHVANSSFRIGGGYWKDWYFVEDNEEIKNVELYEVFSDDELFSTLGIKLLEGRTFNANMPSDSGAAFVINETAARELGWDSPVGKRIYTHPEEKGKWDGTVVGVVADVNISPLYEKVLPLVMRLPWQNDYPDAFVYVRYLGNEQSIIDAIEKKYKAVSPEYPFQFRFVDELYNSRHQKESKAFASLQFSTSIIILISMLGIFSMATYISIRRMKEFGIRKVMGASTSQIARLHIGYFFRLILLANCIALPIAYWIAKQWLNDFAYRVDLSVLPFLLVGGVSLLIVLFSGSYSAWKAGRMNPVEVIKIQ